MSSASAINDVISNLLSADHRTVDAVLGWLNYRQLLAVSLVNRFWHKRVVRLIQFRQGRCISFCEWRTAKDTVDQNNASLADRPQLKHLLSELDWPAGLFLFAIDSSKNKSCQNLVSVPAEVHGRLPPATQAFGAACSGILGWSGTTDHDNGSIIKQFKNVNKECVSGLLLSQTIRTQLGVQIVTWTRHTFNKSTGKQLTEAELFDALGLPCTIQCFLSSIDQVLQSPIRGVVLLADEQKVCGIRQAFLLDCIKQLHINQKRGDQPPFALLGALTQRVFRGSASGVASRALVFTGERARTVSCVFKRTSKSVDVRERFTKLLAELKAQNCSRVLFALVVMCSARTKGATAEANAFRHVMPQVPLLGYFGAGEYGWDTQSVPTNTELDNAQMNYEGLMEHQYSSVWMLVALTD